MYRGTDRQTITQEVPPKYQEAPLSYDRALVQVVHRSHGASLLGHLQKPGPGQLALGLPA